MQVTPVRRTSFAANVVKSSACAVGDVGETVIPSTKLKAGEAFDSALVTELAAGTQFEVVEVGSLPNRIRVTTSAGHAGWISKATEQGSVIVKWVRKRRTSFQQKDFERKTTEDKDSIQLQTGLSGLSVGDVCETVMDMTTLREGEDFKSNAVGQIPQGTQFEIVSVAPANRVKIIVPDTVLEGGAVGWISSHTDTGSKLFKLIRAGPKKRQSSFNLTKNMSIPLGQAPQKATVEAAPPGMRRSLLPVPAPSERPAPAERQLAADHARRSETPEDDRVAQEAPDAKARARGEAAAALRKGAQAAPWWAPLVCCGK